MMAPLFEHYGVQLWMPEAGGRVNLAAEGDEQLMLALGIQSKREITRTKIRVRTAMAAQQAPALVAHAVYLTAFMPASGVSVAAYTRMPENEGGLVRPCLVADPAAVGALRLDVASPDPAYRQRLRETFYGDVEPAVADAAIALLTPDAPAGISVGTTTLTAAGWGSVPRTYVMCTQDMVIRPALQQRFIADADAAFPANPTSVHTLALPVPVDARPGSRHRPQAPPLKGLTKHGGLRAYRPLGAAHAPTPAGRNGTVISTV
jgi:hypothetical protein